MVFYPSNMCDLYFFILCIRRLYLEEETRLHILQIKIIICQVYLKMIYVDVCVVGLFQNVRVNIVFASIQIQLKNYCLKVGSIHFTYYHSLNLQITSSGEYVVVQSSIYHLSMSNKCKGSLIHEIFSSAMKPGQKNSL